MINTDLFGVGVGVRSAALIQRAFTKIQLFERDLRERLITCIVDSA